MVDEDLQGIREKLSEIQQAIANIKGTKVGQ
jgi:hypothetical protein